MKYSIEKTDTCHCCGRAGQRFGPLVMTDKGWTCANDDFCRGGASADKPRDTEGDR